MEATLELLERALTIKPAAQWARELNLDPSTFAQAKRRRHLRAPLAGVLASELGESEEHWMAVAALEAEPDSELKRRLMSLKRWRKRWLSIKAGLRKWADAHGKRSA